MKSTLRVVAALVVSAATMVLVGCSGLGLPSVEPDRSVKAQFDYDRGVIQLLLDPYMYGTEYFPLTSRAIEVGMGPCMRDAGYEYHAASVAASGPPPDTGSQQFGLWSVPIAKQWGIRGPNNPIGEAKEADAARYGEAWRVAKKTCNKTVSDKVYALGPSPDDAMKSVANRLEEQSYALATATGEWKKAKSDWGTCLSKAGLTPRTGPQEWSSAESVALSTSSGDGSWAPPSQESIRLGVIEATCNTETRMAEQMANLQSAYQGALIRGNEAALSQEKTAVQKAITALKDYIAQQRL